MSDCLKTNLDTFRTKNDQNHYIKNLPKSLNQNHKNCITKLPNKRQQKSRNVTGMKSGIKFRIFADGTFKTGEQRYSCIRWQGLLVFCFLTGKTKQHYVQLWRTICDRCATIDFQLKTAFCKFWLRNQCYRCILFDVSICRNLCMQVPFRSGTVAQHKAYRSYKWLQISKKVGHWLHLFYVFCNIMAFRIHLQRVFRAGRSCNSLCSHDSSFCSLSATAVLWYTILSDF